jgi:hypothetical protein
MIIALDDPRISGSGLDRRTTQGAVTFILPPDRADELPRSVKVALADGALAFFPQRSSGQQQLLARLGLTSL